MENKKLKVVWLCYFSNHYVQEILKPKKPGGEFALWITSMISLFENIPADMYISRGTDASQLSSEDRKKIMRLLKNELFPI